ncbi:MAG: hypothetical protein Q9227_000203 [Pyrenula ochraceoflavens]
MASPQTQQPTQTTHPLTPPAEPPSLPSTTAQSANTLTIPSTSLSDPGLSKRPRDARLIHLLLSSLGITSYQERVPLQLLDFAYRYTSSILSDALHLKLEGYDEVSATDAKGKKKGGGGGEEGEISLGVLRTAISSRVAAGGVNGGTGLPREYLMEMAEKRNKVALPVPGAQKSGEKDEGIVMAGVRLPSEKYCLSGVGWGMKEEWSSEGEEENDEGGDPRVDEGGMDEDAEENEIMEDVIPGMGGDDTEMGDA